MNECQRRIFHTMILTAYVTQEENNRIQIIISKEGRRSGNICDM